MSLRQIFTTLAVPSTSDQRLYSAVRLADFSFVRIAIDGAGNPTLLFDFPRSNSSRLLLRTQLKHIQILPSVQCEISEDGRSRIEQLTVVSFQSDDLALRNHFLLVAESLLESLGENPSPESIYHSIQRFLEVFQLLSATPSKSVQGLWAELFLIYQSQLPKTLLRFWHERPESIFDFASGSESVEVKSTSTFQRSHSFSHEQLASISPTTLVASIYVSPTTTGIDVFTLVERIVQRLAGDPEACSKLHSLVFATLGTTLESVGSLRYDLKVAGESLLFYDSRDIPRIDSQYIPVGVRSVRYTSDLSDVSPIELNELTDTSDLFRSL